MNLLLDTHILLWALSDDPKLPEQAREMILSEKNHIFYSILSLWEIELKHRKHPAELPITAHEIAEYCNTAGYTELQLQNQSIYLLKTLQRPEKSARHKDPFDCMLICQAKSVGMLFLTHDSLLTDYNEPCIFFLS